MLGEGVAKKNFFFWRGGGYVGGGYVGGGAGVSNFFYCEFKFKTIFFGGWGGGGGGGGGG